MFNEVSTASVGNTTSSSKCADADGDSICDTRDLCPNDAENDADGDGICGSVDSCPNDASNSLDCAAILPCAYSPFSSEILEASPDLFVDFDSDGCLDAISLSTTLQPELAAAITSLVQAAGTRINVSSVAFDATTVIIEGSRSLALSPARAEKALAQSVGIGAHWINAVSELDEILALRRALASSAAFSLALNGNGATRLLLDDVDNDGITDSLDSCPFDPLNDLDSDNLCTADMCFDLFFEADLFCSSYRPDGRLSRRCGTNGRCRVCSCSCYIECVGDIDSCPADEFNDIDSDGVCGDVDSCPIDESNDLDSDSLCASVDPCPADLANDVDSDELCGDVDSCGNDPVNDADSDAICGDVDSCPLDYMNDGDADSLCASEDSCQFDAGNDSDSDSICDDVDSCLFNADNDADSDGRCDTDIVDVVAAPLLTRLDAIILGSVVAVVFLIVIIVVVTVLCCRREQQKRQRLAQTYAMDVLSTQPSPQASDTIPKATSQEASQVPLPAPPPPPEATWEPDPQEMTAEHFEQALKDFYAKYQPRRLPKVFSWLPDRSASLVDATSHIMVE